MRTKALRPIRSCERFVLAGDNHGDLRDTEACSAVIEFCKHFKPQVRVHMGDCFDFRWLRKSADKDEKDANITEDVNAGIEFLTDYRPTHFLRGNHDQRIYDLLDSSTGFLSDLAHRVVADIEKNLHGVVTFPYDKRRGVFQYGDLNLLHGYSAGVNALRRAVMSFGNCAMGHIHRTDQISVERLERVRGYAIGALCTLDLDYNRAQLGTLAQNNGFAFGIKRGNKTRLWLVEKFDGEWIFPSELATYG